MTTSAVDRVIPYQGYDLKAEQISLSLMPLGLENLAVGFFNALEDAPSYTSAFLLQHLGGLRAQFRARLSTETDGAITLDNNHREGIGSDAISDASKSIHLWSLRLLEFRRASWLRFS